MNTAVNQAQDDFGGGDEAGGGEDVMDMDSMGLNSGGNANKDKLPGQVAHSSQGYLGIRQRIMN